MYFECESENHCTYINILVIIHSSYTYTCMSHKSCHCFTMHNTASTMSNPSIHVRQLTQLDLFNLQKSLHNFVSLHYLVPCPCFHSFIVPSLYLVYVQALLKSGILLMLDRSQAPLSLPRSVWNT